MSDDKPDPTQDALLWLVSFGDEDDRELRPPEIAEALRRGMIDGDTIVWREGQEDWAPLGSIPSLARLLPSSGETAGAPVVAMLAQQVGAAAKSDGASAVAAPRTMSKEPSKPAAKVLPRPAAEAVPKDPQSGTPTEPLVADPKGSPAGDASKKSADAWRGKTRLGLPKAPETKPVALTGADPKPLASQSPLPTVNRPDTTNAPKVAAKIPEPPKVVVKTPDVPKVVSKTPDVPKVVVKTPDVPKVAVKTADAPKVEKSPSSQKGTGQNLWDDSADEALSVEPESIRPLSPSPGMAKATALSSGTLGGPPARKPPPPAPRKKPPAPPARPAPEMGTPTIPNAATVAKKNERVDDDFLNLGNLGGGGGGMAGALLAPAVDLAAFAEDPVFSAEGPPLSVEEVPVEEVSGAAADDTATVPLATSVALKETGSPVVATKPSAPKEKSGVALATPKEEKKRSLAPIGLAAAAAAVVLLVFMRRPGDAPKPPVPEETPRTTTEAPAPAENQPTPAATVAEAPAAPPAPSAAAPSAAAAAPAEAAAHPTTTVAASAGDSHAVKGAATEPTATKAATTPAPAEKAPKPEKEATPAATAKAEPKPVEEPKAVDMGGEFDKSAAATALSAAADQASGCRKDGDPSGVAVVHVTFANSGRATRTTIEGPPFAGTPTGGCIAAALRGAQVPPYGGDRVTVTKRVVIR